MHVFDRKKLNFIFFISLFSGIAALLCVDGPEQNALMSLPTRKAVEHMCVFSTGGWKFRNLGRGGVGGSRVRRIKLPIHHFNLNPGSGLFFPPERVLWNSHGTSVVQDRTGCFLTVFSLSGGGGR